MSETLIEAKEDFGFTMPESGLYLVGIDSVSVDEKERGPVYTINFVILQTEEGLENFAGLKFNLFFCLYKDMKGYENKIKELHSVLLKAGIIKKSQPASFYFDENNKNKIVAECAKGESTLVLGIKIDGDFANIKKVTSVNKWKELSGTSELAKASSTSEGAEGGGSDF